MYKKFLFLGKKNELSDDSFGKKKSNMVDLTARDKKNEEDLKESSHVSFSNKNKDDLKNTMSFLESLTKGNQTLKSLKFLLINQVILLSRNRFE